jgi:anthranilate phosphoribosyltransferase
MNSPHFTVVYGEDEASGKALGEFSVSGPNLIRATRGEENLSAGAFRPGSGRVENLFVTDAQESAARLVAILRREDTGLARAMLLANAALAARTQGAASSWEEAHEKCVAALDSGAALAVLEKWRKFSARLK